MPVRYTDGREGYTLTNATKANIIAVVNAALSLALLFGLPLTEQQFGGIMVLVNAVGILVVGLTYKNSAKRVPEIPDEPQPGHEH